MRPVSDLLKSAGRRSRLTARTAAEALLPHLPHEISVREARAQLDVDTADGRYLLELVLTSAREALNANLEDMARASAAKSDHTSVMNVHSH